METPISSLDGFVIFTTRKGEEVPLQPIVNGERTVAYIPFDVDPAWLVRACNSHSDLLEACKAAVEDKKRHAKRENILVHLWPDWFYKADAAIRKAEEGGAG